MRYFFLFLMVVGLASCGHREVAPADTTPLDQKLGMVATLHNTEQYDALRTYFARGARVQLPATPRSGTLDQYLQAMSASPYKIAFTDTEVVYALTGRAATRSTVTATAPGQPTIRERVTIDWLLEDGYWRIAAIKIVDWPAIIGTWRRSGLRQEGSIELRILPGGVYQVYLAEDYSHPAFRGNYTLEGNKITFKDLSAFDAKMYQGGSGSYMFLSTPTGVDFRKVEDENTWRGERYDGSWTAAR